VSLVVSENRIPAMSVDAIAQVRELEQISMTLPQVPIATHHVLHGGLYARTITIPAGVVLTGALIKIPTLLIVSGHVAVTVGEKTVELAGYNVLPASAGRKQAYLALSDTEITMVFPTSAMTVEEAEDEFTNEAYLLFSRSGENMVVITGE
jgi:hypothetical protein